MSHPKFSPRMASFSPSITPCTFDKHCMHSQSAQMVALLMSCQRLCPMDPEWRPDLLGALALLLRLLNAHQRGPAQRGRLELCCLSQRLRLSRPHRRARCWRHWAPWLSNISICAYTLHLSILATGTCVQCRQSALWAGMHHCKDIMGCPGRQPFPCHHLSYGGVQSLFCRFICHVVEGLPHSPHLSAS